MNVLSMPVSTQVKPQADIRVHESQDLATALPRLEQYVLGQGVIPLSRHTAWLQVLADGLGHVPYCLEAATGSQTLGILPLAYVRSLLFGKFLVSLPYLNYGGVLAEDLSVAGRLIDHAVQLAQNLDVRYLELRHQQLIEHPDLAHARTEKVHMRLSLPDSEDELWRGLDPKVRNQIRKGQKSGLSVFWGSMDFLPDFYAVFSRNMRDLGTPVYGRTLFRSILERFPDRAEICLVRCGAQPVAAALVLHGWGVSEVPSASSLRPFNSMNGNMLMYWNLLQRAIARQQTFFDFGRSSRDSSTFAFKKQWGALPLPAEWQYCLRRGSVQAMRPENPRFKLWQRAWQKLPVWLTRLLGPKIVRGIP